MNTVGSTWNKWDLHVHTPASFHWEGDRFEGKTPEQKDAICNKVIDAMNATDVIAFCIMDYWTFEGYKILNDYISRHPDATTKRIFPGIEFRLDAPTNYRLNAHVLFSDELPLDTLDAFLTTLRFSGPVERPVTRANFIALAQNYAGDKLRLHGFKIEDRGNDAKMLECGMKTAEVSRESLKHAIETVGKEHCLFILPYDTSDGVSDLDWQCHPYSDATLMKWADCFESRKKVHVDLFLGNGHPTKPQIGLDFIENLGGFPKPVFSGSDAHKTSMYGVYPSERATWLKAQPTFKGLRQVCNEPSLRCHIGDRPEKVVHCDQNPTKYIKTLRLTKVVGSLLDEHWFHGCEIELNPGLVAIVGNKGSGKSALADILALGANSHCSSMEFLNGERFRRSTDNKAQHFEATLLWADGAPVQIGLANDADLHQPERVRYLPQHFIEDLCNEIATGNDTRFESELRKVIFEHVPAEKQLGTGSLNDLLEYLEKAKRQAIAQLQQSIQSLNANIIRNEQEMSHDTVESYKKALALKQAELEAIDKVPLAVVEQPPEDPDDETTKQAVEQIETKKEELAKINEQISTLQTERQELSAESASLNRLLGHVENFESQRIQFIEENQQEFEDAGFDINTIVNVTINREPLTERFTAVKAKLAEIAVLLDGKPATEEEEAVPGLTAAATVCDKAITAMQDGLAAPQKAYQAYLKEQEARNKRKAAVIGNAETADTIVYYEERIKRATKVIPDQLSELREERRQLVRELHEELVSIQVIYEDLYAPVQKIASEAAESPHAVQLEFDASVVNTGFETNFLDFIHKGKKGNFYGEEESRTLMRDLLRSYDFNSSDEVVNFTDEIIDKLTNFEKDGEKVPISIRSQLRDKKILSDLYDYIFCMKYLDIRYNLRLGGKDISQLSPGEKGALLLVFYLLLDTEEIPIIIDQPEHNLDNESVVRLLVDCIRKARARRQVFIVTHNPNLAVYCDADQLICCSIDKADGHKIKYSTGAIEDYKINNFAVNVLEGTYPAFDNRRKKWHKPLLAYEATIEEVGD
ncbi:AAA family ATPase [Roseiconus nitratireducens]|uniref:AAA family ATPase n=1 Tax=Roseiconus nitratireducens TaxID=2605748 RepID=A0A5M6CKU7_9BACT|nr:AAA family ATPase [Roseiconus nitratireducens]KAA5535673.1 AAA family ATPase [Roseiconus nitratireducens]